MSGRIEWTMSIKKDEIGEIIAARLNGEEISGEEKAVLQQWLEEDANRKQFLRLESYYRELSVGRQVDEEKAYRVVFGKIRQQNRRKRMERIQWWSAVASIAVLGFATLWLLLHTGVDRPLELASADFTVADSTGVILQLADGRRISLEHEDSLVFRNTYGLVSTGGGVLNVIASRPTEEREKGHTVLKIPRGKEYRVMLPDSSRVWLNTGSRLRFPQVFATGERRVYLEGEAYFEVNKAGEWPFIVVADGIDVRVTGTRFDVKAYTDEKTVYATLISGAVEVVPGGMACRGVELKPSQQFVFNRKSLRQEVRKVDPFLCIAWINHMFAFQNQRLEDVMYDLSQWYDVEFVFADEEAADMRISGNIERKRDLNSVLDMIMRLKKVEIDRFDGKYIIRAK